MSESEENSASTFLVRRADERGISEFDWLKSRHSFSFANYYNPAHMGFRSLRVINDDIVAPGSGFETHPHDNMEIFSYVIDGALEHKDSMGNGRIIQAGEFQYMSAGEGITHSEFNPSQTEHVNFLQVWIEPNVRGGTPRYEDRKPDTRAEVNGLTLLASDNGRGASISIRQQAEIYFGNLSAGASKDVELDEPLAHAWLQLVQGRLRIDNEILYRGDGASVTNGNVTITADEASTLFLLKLN